MSNIISGKNVMVTGASSHIGYHVASYLKDLNCNFLVRSENYNVSISGEKGCIVKKADIMQPYTYKNYFKNINYLFHSVSDNTITGIG